VGLFYDILLEEEKKPEPVASSGGIFDDILAEPETGPDLVREDTVTQTPVREETVGQARTQAEEKPSGLFDDIVSDQQPQSSTPDLVPDEKLTPSQSAVARESLGRFAKGALVTGPAAIARTYGLVESAAGIPIQGEPYNFESTAGARIARGLEQAGERLYPTIPEAQGSFIPEVAGGLGQVSTIVAGGPIARAAGIPASVAPRAVAAGTGVVLGAGEGAQRASQAGAKPEEILTAGFLNGVTGLSEVFPAEKWIEKIDKATAGKFSRDVRRYFIEAGVEAGTEALQEAFQTTMGNLIAKGQYRPEQDVLEGAGKAALVGGTVGAIASGVIGGFGLSQARRNQDVATTEPQAESIQPDARMQAESIQPDVRPQAEVQPEVQAQPQQEGLQPFTEFQRPEEQAPRSGIETKVSDKDGNPLTVFHGTTQRFDKFKDGRIWFSADRNFAEIYKQDQPDGDVKELNVVIKNPKTFSSDNVGRSQWVETTDAGLKRDGFDGVLFLKPDGSIDDGYAFKGDQILIREPKKPALESPAAQERVTSQEITQPALTSFESPKDLERAFSDIGEGHRRFASRLSTMITFDAMTPEARDLILATIYDNNVNDEYLQQIEVGPLTRGARPAGRGGVVTQPVQGKPDAITGQVTSKGNKPFLGIRQGARLTSIKDRDFEFLDIFWHEYGHAGYYSLLTSDQKKLVSSEYKKTTRKGRSEFFLKGTARGLDRYADYYAKNESEWFAQSFSEWVITEKTSQTKLVPLFEKILQRLKNVFEKLFQRKNIESLSDIYEYILKGEAYGKKPLWSRWDMSRNPTDYDRPIKRIDRNFIKVQKRLDQKAGESRIDGQQFKNISQPESKPPSSIEPPSPPPTQPPASPEPQPNPMPKIPAGAKLKPYLDNFRRTFQDKFVDVENLQKGITKGQFELPDAVNIKQAEELYHGRTGERLTEFDENTARPLIEEISALNIGANLPWVKAIGDKYYKGRKNPDGSDRKFVPSRDIFDLYAIAKHGTERNQLIAQRTPELAGRGSGLTDAQIKSILETEIPEDVRARMEPARQRLVEMSRRALADRLAGGLINRETYDLLTTRFQDYVPLRGKEGGTEFERMEGTGTGFDVRGREIRRAEGRESLPTDVVAYAIMQSTDSIIRAEKNAVMQTAARFAEAYPDNGVIEKVGRGELMRTYGIETDDGTIYRRFVDETLRNAPNIISYKADGVENYLRINDPKLADIMKNRASPVLGSFVERLASLNRYFAFINTQASPEFIISNFARDLQTALVNINQNDAKGLATDLVKNIPASLKATFRAELGTPEANNRMDLFYNEFKREGGRMTFFGLKDFATLQKQIQKEVARGGSNSATRVFGKALDFVGKANSAVENATRLATYATLRERGYTPKQSAYAARNITVNFTRKGTAGPLLNSFYLFFNANIQGSARIIQALATSKKAQRIMLGVMAFGFFRDILNRILGGEDETGVPFYDKIPEYTRRQNFVLMNPLRQGTGEYVKFPMPYGYSVFDYAGQLMASVMPKEILGGGMKPSKAAFRLSMAAVDNFNPIGGSYHILQAVSPTIMTPLTDLALNMDFSGRPIMPTPNPFDPTPPPDSQRYWNNVSPVSKWVTEKINEITGGSKARAGAVDVSPETLDYAVEFLSGAVGKFGERLVTLPFRGMAAAQGDLPLEDLVGEIPMYRKLSGRVPSYVDISRYQEMRSEVLKISEELKIAQKEGERAKAIEIRRDAQPELRMVGFIKSTEQRLKELRSERRRLQEAYKRTENEAVLNRIRDNRERQKELMLKALDRYNSSVDDKM